MLVKHTIRRLSISTAGDADDEALEELEEKIAKLRELLQSLGEAL